MVATFRTLSSDRNGDRNDPVGSGSNAFSKAIGAGLLALVWMLAGCASSGPDLTALDREIEVERFMGDWYVIAFIPIDLFFFSEADAHDAVENYRLHDDGEIDVTYTFRDGGFDVEPTVMHQSARVFDRVRGTEWRQKVFGPFEAAYLIAWVDEAYQRAIVGVPSRSNVWLLSRTPRIPEAEWTALTDRIARLGYDPSLLKRVPHQTAND